MRIPQESFENSSRSSSRIVCDTKKKCRWVATTNERSMSRTIVPAGITRIDNGGKEGQGKRWIICSIEPAVFLSPCERSTWGWMWSLIWGKLRGVIDRDPLFSVYFRRIAQNVIPRLWWRSTRALERSARSRWQIVFASSLDPRNHFVLRYSICLVSRDEKSKQTSNGSRVVH